MHAAHAPVLQSASYIGHCVLNKLSFKVVNLVGHLLISFLLFCHNRFVAAEKLTWTSLDAT